MFGTYPYTAPTPLDYRYGLDAAMAVLAHRGPPLVCCGVAELRPEIAQRIPSTTSESGAEAALWVEPLHENWRADLARLADNLTGGAVLVVLASRPLARLVPERRHWQGVPLGMQVGGIARLCRALRRAGLRIEQQYGIHAAGAIGLSMAGQFVTRRGRLDLGDRLQFAARLRYCTSGPLAGLSTVALLVSHKQEPA